MKAYIGDGVYADIKDGFLILTTENGICTTNTIWMDEAVLQHLMKYLERATDYRVKFSLQQSAQDKAS
jgi:hypothetical protein